MKKKAIILLSGGLDSATTLAIAHDRGYDCHVLSFNYSQRSFAEINSAKKLCEAYGVKHHEIINLASFSFLGSALTDTAIDIPDYEEEGIPSTYVPARNTVFLSLALAWAEVLGAKHIFIGVNEIDFGGYPDCSPEYVQQFQDLANMSTKTALMGEKFKIEAPLVHMNKAQIIQAGTALGVDYALTCSCYQADDEGRACGVCTSCTQRAQGFLDAGITDPTRYITTK